MKEDYTDIIQQVSQALFEAIKEREENLSEQVKELDGELAKLLRLVGHEVLSTPRLDMLGLVLEWGKPQHPSRSKSSFTRKCSIYLV